MCQLKDGEAGGAAGRRKRFLLAGGGTGGHIYPALAIARELLTRHPDSEVLFIGGTRGLERELIPREGFAFRAISVSGLKRRLSLDTLATLGQAGLGVAQSISIVARFGPDAAIGTGGYASGPAMLAASWLGVPVLIHEQNVVPGATNRMLSGRASIVAISWEESRKYLKRPGRAVLTGNPVRQDVITATREEGLASFGLDASRPTVLAFGGSQGSASINRAFISALPALRARVNAQFMLATGRDKFSESIACANDAGVPTAISSDGIARSERGDIILMPYIYNMPHALACANLVIARSGAITLAELAIRGVPAVLIPHPLVPDNVQEKNARAMERRGAARVVLDRELEPAGLARLVGSLLADPGALRAMADASRSAGIPDAACRAADCVEQIMRSGSGGRGTCSRMGLLS